MPKHKSHIYLEDTTSFLQFLESYKQDITQNTFLVTLDIVSLYTNIPHVEGIELVTQYYQETLPEWPQNSDPKPITSGYLSTLIKFILENCTFCLASYFTAKTLAPQPNGHTTLHQRCFLRHWANVGFRLQWLQGKIRHW